MTDHSPLAFAAAGHDRCAELRGDAARQAVLLSDPDTRVLPMWRGKPLIGAARLGWVRADSPVLRHGVQPLTFLGLDPTPRFAADISGWEPDALDRTALAMFQDTTEQHFPGLPEDMRFRDLRAWMTGLPSADAAVAATARALFNWHRTHGFCAACGSASEVAMAGWQRACPACGAQHFPRTDPVVIMLITRGNRALLGRSPGWPEGMYSLLAGFIEPGESIEAAVRREVAEETGVQVGAVRYLASQPWPFPASLMLGCHGDALSDTITVDAELDDALWLTREELMAAHAGQHPRITPARKGAIAHHLIGMWLAGAV